MNIVNMNSVSKSYNASKVLDNISLEIEEGERVVFIGPSGCGKTTILRLIAGLVTPDNGTVSISGKKVSEAGTVIVPPEKRNLGMVFQDLALWPHLTVKGNVEFGLKAKGMPKSERNAHIHKILSLMSMEDYAGRKPGELSGGQQQRVALARALVLEPKVLLMDEPLSGLDFELNRRIRSEIIKLQEKLKFTLLYVTHNHEEIYDLATSVIFMTKGRIEYTGTADNARERYERSHTF